MLNLPQVIIEKVTTTNDRCFKITLTTQEMSTLPDETKLAILNAVQEFKGVNLEKVVPKGTKSLSKRLKDVIWRLWEQSGQKFTEDEYYKLTMEQIINKLKDKLN